MVDIKQEVSFQRIADIMTTAMECNDMTASWCTKAERTQFTAELDSGEGPWYSKLETYADPMFKATFTVDYGDGDSSRQYELTAASVAIGLQLMADKQPRHFADFMNEGEDAITADVFLQCCLLQMVIFG